MSTTALPTIAREETPFRRFVAEFAASRIALAALVVFLLIALAAIFAALIVPQNPYDLAQLDIMDGRLPPGSASAAGYTYILGTDDLAPSQRTNNVTVRHNVFDDLTAATWGAGSRPIGCDRRPNALAVWCWTRRRRRAGRFVSSGL